MSILGISSAVLSIVGLLLTVLEQFRMIGLAVAIVSAILGLYGLGKKIGPRIIEGIAILISFMAIAVYIISLI